MQDNGGTQCKHGGIEVPPRCWSVTKTQEMPICTAESRIPRPHRVY